MQDYNTDLPDIKGQKERIQMIVSQRFEVSTASGTRVGIASVAISGSAIVITCASGPGPGARAGYAMVGEKNQMATPFPGTFRWGLLKDSDSFKGAGTGTVRPNYGVAFEVSVP